MCPDYAGGMYRDSNMKTYISIDSQRECAIRLREVKLGLCNNLEGWYGEGGLREGTYVYL